MNDDQQNEEEKKETGRDKQEGGEVVGRVFGGGRLAGVEARGGPAVIEEAV